VRKQSHGVVATTANAHSAFNDPFASAADPFAVKPTPSASIDAFGAPSTSSAATSAAPALVDAFGASDPFGTAPSTSKPAAAVVKPTVVDAFGSSSAFGDRYAPQFCAVAIVTPPYHTLEIVMHLVVVRLVRLWIQLLVVDTSFLLMLGGSAFGLLLDSVRSFTKTVDSYVAKGGSAFGDFGSSSGTHPKNESFAFVIVELKYRREQQLALAQSMPLGRRRHSVSLP
jgi:hypothetical protein